MKTAFIFPGQGSQAVGMLSAAAEAWPVIEQTFAEASNVLGYDLWELCQKGPAEDLNQTMVTQPALLTASIALWRQWFIAGEGSMAAILGLEDADVIAACEEAANGDVVSAVNFNAPGQVVIAGGKTAVERAIEACKARGARKAMLLPVSVPSHCALMKGASEELAKALDDVNFGNALTPVVQNVTAEVVQDAEALKQNLVQQLYSPVRCCRRRASLWRSNVVLARFSRASPSVSIATCMWAVLKPRKASKLH